MPNGMFINVILQDKIKKNKELAKKIIEVCPVDIFELKDNELNTKEEFLDECTLCDLCINIVKDDSIIIKKLY